MTAAAVPTRAIFDMALKAGRQAGQATTIETGLNAPLLAALQGKVDKAWNEIAKTLDKAFIYGRAKVQEALDASVQTINSLLASAGEQVQLMHQLLLEKLQAFMRKFLEQTIGLLPATVSASGVTLNIAGMTFTQKLKLGGSIEANLAALA